ncbi:DUF3313 family protein [Gilvimarinus algae]|uniref:DUF3313 family protein n=1 Tax=Gilvimarinus algae TaxID=3058037 RepID=A0ABT8TFS0_9GAMM|nr:DUF3313 family protein [Gilvimarinus sp. SDUM040014]MDO3382919.1 DUF3313 family protein [Gilvimarinus sp. SDUM040014]
MKSSLSIGASLLALLAVGCATPPPPVSHDGLHLVENRDLDEVYLKPGIELADYTAVSLKPCTVAFRANYMRDQNSNRGLMRDRVTEEDMQVIQARFAKSCDEHFREALQDSPAYKIVEQGSGEERVLDIRPAVIDLDLTAPDINSPGISRTYTTSSGEMTLFLEAYDGTTGEIIARVVDEKEDRDDMYLEWTNRASNMHDANRAFASWTRSLRRALDQARQL